MKRTFGKMSELLNVASSSQTNDSQTTLDDDDLLNHPDLLAMLAAIDEACVKRKGKQSVTT